MISKVISLFILISEQHYRSNCSTIIGFFALNTASVLVATSILSAGTFTKATSKVSNKLFSEFNSKMILRWFIMVGVFWAVNTRPLMKKLSFEGCKNDSWRVTDIFLEPDGDKIYVTADVGFDEKISNKLHQIKLTLLGCGENYKCTNHTNVLVNEVDCLSNNGTELDQEACDVAKTLAEWEQDAGEISQEAKKNKTSIGTGPEKMCIHYDTKLIDVNATAQQKGSESIQFSSN